MARLLTARQAAALVGVEVETLRSWRKRGHLTPAGKTGRALLYRPADVYDAEARARRADTRKIRTRRLADRLVREAGGAPE